MTKRPRLSVYPDDALLGRGSPIGEWDADAGRFDKVRAPARAILELGPNGMGVDFAKPKKKRASPEALIQRAIIDRLRLCGVLCVHVPNAGKRSAIAGRRLKSEGMRPGWPDLICVQDGRVAFLEVKGPGGRLSPAQVECHDELRRQACRVEVVTSQDDAVRQLRLWGFRL